MLEEMYVIGFLGMIVLPIAAWIAFTRRLDLSWRLVLAGGLTFIASQVPHIPLVTAMGPWMAGNSLLVNAILLGLFAGVFEETARYILFKFIIKNARTWKEGILVGLGHGGTEALILGVLSVAAFVIMLAYRSIDLSTVPGIPADQVGLAKQQVTAYWSVPPYLPLLGFVERISAMCLHVSLSMMVLLAVASGKPIWFWIALLWHALVDAVAVYSLQAVGVFGVEVIVAGLAVVSLILVSVMRPMFPGQPADVPAEAVPA